MYSNSRPSILPKPTQIPSYNIKNSSSSDTSTGPTKSQFKANDLSNRSLKSAPSKHTPLPIIPRTPQFLIGDKRTSNSSLKSVLSKQFPPLVPQKSTILREYDHRLTLWYDPPQTVASKQPPPLPPPLPPRNRTVLDQEPPKNSFKGSLQSGPTEQKAPLLSRKPALLLKNESDKKKKIGSFKSTTSEFESVLHTQFLQNNSSLYNSYSTLERPKMPSVHIPSSIQDCQKSNPRLIVARDEVISTFPAYEEPSFLFTDEQNQHELKETIQTIGILDLETPSIQVVPSFLQRDTSVDASRDKFIGPELVAYPLTNKPKKNEISIRYSDTNPGSPDSHQYNHCTDWSGYSQTKEDTSESEYSSERSSICSNLYEDITYGSGTLTNSTFMLRRTVNTKLLQEQSSSTKGKDDLNRMTHGNKSTLHMIPSRNNENVPKVSNTVDTYERIEREPKGSPTFQVETRVVIKGTSWFIDEPLYQFYTDTLTDEAVYYNSSGKIHEGNEVADESHKISDKQKQFADGCSRLQWRNLPEVIASVDLAAMNKEQLYLQELKYEMLTTEASFLNSMRVLEQHFALNHELDKEAMLSDEDRTSLFSKVKPVRLTSTLLLKDLTKCWEEDIMLTGIMDILYMHITNNFQSYVAYCANQEYMNQTHIKLRDQNSLLQAVFKDLESSVVCQRLPLQSFLTLPMQRITRLLLLVETMLKRIPNGCEDYDTGKKVVEATKKVVEECNAMAEKSNKRMKRLQEINMLLKFKSDIIEPLHLISKDRWLVMSGSVIKHSWPKKNSTLRRKMEQVTKKTTIMMYLFNDLIVFTKKKSENCYSVVDYCSRNLTIANTTRNVSHLPSEFTADSENRHMLMLTMLENHEKRYAEMILSCARQKDRDLWLFQLNSSKSIKGDDVIEIFEEWDCPIVIVTIPFTATHDDHLTLVPGETVKVIMIYADGWFQGIKARDGDMGLFPASCVKEVPSPHEHARKLKQIFALTHVK